MKIVADENVDRLIIERLRQSDHVVVAIVEQRPSLADPDVLHLALHEGALLITEDRDFGELIFHRSAKSCGVLLVRLEGVPRKDRIELVCNAILRHEDELSNAFSVLTPQNIRIRPL